MERLILFDIDGTAVRELSLAVPRGSVYGLLGPNGAGKTTTIRMILNVIAPDSGSITVRGSPHLTPGLLDRLGYLPEERGLYNKMQVRRLLRFLAELKGVDGKTAYRRITEWLERLSLKSPEKGWGNAKVDELSRGMQQKVQFIGTLLHDPDVVILDEPFSGLDPINAQALDKAARRAEFGIEMESFPADLYPLDQIESGQWNIKLSGARAGDGCLVVEGDARSQLASYHTGSPQLVGQTQQIAALLTRNESGKSTRLGNEAGRVQSALLRVTAPDGAAHRG